MNASASAIHFTPLSCLVGTPETTYETVLCMHRNVSNMPFMHTSIDHLPKRDRAREQDGMQWCSFGPQRP